MSKEYIDCAFPFAEGMHKRGIITDAQLALVKERTTTPSPCKGDGSMMMWYVRVEFVGNSDHPNWFNVTNEIRRVKVLKTGTRYFTVTADRAETGSYKVPIPDLFGDFRQAMMEAQKRAQALFDGPLAEAASKMREMPDVVNRLDPDPVVPSEE